MVSEFEGCPHDGDDILKEGSIFHWSTFGLLLESKVNEFVPFTRIG